jgi:ATP-dependent DNA ligase
MTPLPRWIGPQLCRLVTKIPAGDARVHEIKFDGFPETDSVGGPGRAG